MNNLSIKKIEKKHLLQVYQLLQDLSNHNPDPDQHDLIWDNFNKQEHVYGWVILLDEQVIGYGSVVLEKKIRGGLSAHIEDIVISRAHRNKKLGQLLMQHIVNFANSKGCYKASLQCASKNIGFYHTLDFHSSGAAMQKFF